MKSKQFSIRLKSRFHPRLHHWLKSEAKRRGQPMNGTICDILDDYRKADTVVAEIARKLR